MPADAKLCECGRAVAPRIPVALIIILLLFGVAAVAMVPSFIRARARGPSTGCESNLKNIGTALEMYSTDNSGRYPPHLSYLVPNYLRAIPTCLSAGADTYSPGYVFASHPDAYTFCCRGSNHTVEGFAANFPQYNSSNGLVTGH